MAGSGPSADRFPRLIVIALPLLTIVLFGTGLRVVVTMAAVVLAFQRSAAAAARTVHAGAEVVELAERRTGTRHADLTSVVTHQGRDGVTSQLAKGVVRDTARGVFQGRIVVDPAETYDLMGMAQNTGWPNPLITRPDGSGSWHSPTSGTSLCSTRFTSPTMNEYSVSGEAARVYS